MRLTLIFTLSFISLFFSCMQGMSRSEFILMKGVVGEYWGDSTLGDVQVEVFDSTHLITKTVTDSLGRYNLIIIPGKKYTVYFKKQYYYTETRRINVENIHINSNIDLSIQLYDTRRAATIPGVEFDLDKATLRPSSKVVLNELLPILIDNPQFVMEIGVHTDYRWSDAYSWRPSQARAQSIVDYLVLKGIHRERLVPKGFADGKPRVVPPKGESVKDQLEWENIYGKPYRPGIELSPEWIDGTFSKKSDGWEHAMQLNRRVEMQVLRDDFVAPND